MLKFKKLTLENVFFALTIFLFISIRLPYFANNLYVPDEIYHTQLMNKFHLINFEAFGTSYWVFGHLLKVLFHHQFLLILRLLSFAFTCLAFYLFYQIAKVKNKNNAKMIAIVLMTTPVVWYGGKLITPEFFQIGLFAISAYYIFTKPITPNWAIVLIGFTFGIKVSSLPTVFSLLLFELFYKQALSFRNKNLYRQALKISGLILLGLIICSPNMVFNPPHFIQHLTANSLHNPALNLNMFFRKQIVWDFVNNDGIFYSSISFISWLALSLYILSSADLKLISIYLLSLSSFFVATYLNGSFLAWHAFPCILIIWLPVIFAKANQRIAKTLLVVAIISNVLVVLQFLPRDLKTQAIFSDYFKNASQYQSCLQDILVSAKQNGVENVLCYTSYRYQANGDNFCDIHRLSQMTDLSLANYTPHDLPWRKFLHSKQHQSHFIVILNREINAVDGSSFDELIPINQEINPLIFEQKAKISFKKLGQCRNYDVYEYAVSRY